MNRKAVFNTFGRILILLAVLLLIPAAVSLFYPEEGTKTLFAFLCTAAGSAILGGVIVLLCRSKNKVIFAKEGFAIVALSWIGMSLVGALPFVLSGEVNSYIDALFETISGLTTTGASCLTNYDTFTHALLFWRSFTHWLGGMGVLVFIMAIMSNISDRSIHIMRAEMPGPIIGKLVPRTKDTAKILYIMYIVFTVAETIALRISGMPLFDSTVHALGTAGTGGFGIRLDSLASYGTASQIVIIVFMLLFGINFNLYYLLLMKKFKSVFKSTELLFYLGLFVFCSIAITCNLFLSGFYPTIGESIKQSAFHVSSFVTTSGFTIGDVNNWPGLSKGILVILMFFGSCAGSTAGGLKLARVLILYKLIRREIKKMLHPRAVTPIHFEGKELDDSTATGVANYFAVYMTIVLATFLLVSFEPFGFEANFTATVSAFNNIGPLFSSGERIISDFSQYSVFSKLVFSFAMLLGRLEIYPLLIACSPSTWKREK